VVNPESFLGRGSERVEAVGPQAALFQKLGMVLKIKSQVFRGNCVPDAGAWCLPFERKVRRRIGSFVFAASETRLACKAPDILRGMSLGATGYGRRQWY